jgi:hypothetical protein
MSERARTPLAKSGERTRSLPDAVNSPQTAGGSRSHARLSLTGERETRRRMNRRRRGPQASALSPAPSWSRRGVVGHHELRRLRAIAARDLDTSIFAFASSSVRGGCAADRAPAVSELIDRALAGVVRARKRRRADGSRPSRRHLPGSPPISVWGQEGDLPFPSQPRRQEAEK